MRTTRTIAITLLSLAPALGALADDAPAPPPPQHEFIGKGQFGFLESRGQLRRHFAQRQSRHHALRRRLEKRIVFRRSVRQERRHRIGGALGISRTD